VSWDAAVNIALQHRQGFGGLVGDGSDDDDNTVLNHPLADTIIDLRFCAE